MSTITLDHLSEPQRQALQGVPPAPIAGLPGIAARFHHQAAKAAILDCPALGVTLRGFARLAAALVTTDEPTRWDAADPGAAVPAALLSPDGRYSCDACESLVERADLTPMPHGFFCPHCAVEQAA